jgi:Patatin-like phospholipase
MLRFEKGAATLKSLTLAQVLEEEFELLHRPLPAGLSSGDSDDVQLAALREQIHRLEEKPAALCLSGGGIRSATFALGVLQGLARIGWLERFHYLSTVSGGGYIGSWLSSWIQRRGPEEALDGLKCARDAGTSVRAEPNPIRWLRMYSSYLSPKRGVSVDFLTLIATFVRNLLLNWIVFLPLISAVMIVPRFNIAMIYLRGGMPFGLLGLGAAALLGAFGIAYAMSDLPGKGTQVPTKNHFVLYCLVPLSVATVLLSWAWPSYAKSGDLHAYGWWWLAYCVGGSTAVHVVGIIGGLALRAYRRVSVEPGAEVPSLVRQVRASVAARQAPEVKPSRLDILLILVSGPATGWVLSRASAFAAPLLSGVDVKGTDGVSLYATLAVPFLLGCAWLWIATYVGFARRSASEDDREWWGRASAYILAVAVVWIVGNGLVLFGLPWARGIVTYGLAYAGGVTGMLTAIIGYFNGSGRGILAERQPGVAALTGRTLLNVAALVSIVMLLLLVSAGEATLLSHVEQATLLNRAVAYLADHLLHGSPEAHANILRVTLCGVLLVAFALLVAVAVGASWFIGANTFSLHGMYGNRLVRAYLGATHSPRDPQLFTGFDPLDNLPMKHLKARTEETRRLLHVINVTLNIVQGARLEWQQRKAESFTISPLHCGSLEVGYQRTDDPSAQRPADNYAGGMTLGRALTISGAAASPNMGYHSSPLVTFVMAFFNVRLGWWLPNPRERAVASKSEPAGVLALMNEALGWTTDQSSWVYLSDGGHFENLGLYEMVLRRCHKIVVVDGTADPDYQFEDLENAIRKIRTDLGIAIEFPHGLPKPQMASQREIHYTIGTIPYGQADPNGVDGYVVYVKPVLSGDEPVDIRRYAETHNDRRNLFPHQSTADQFFDEAQFESYRELGLHSVLTSFPNWESQSLKTWEPPIPAVSSGPAAPAPPEPPRKGNAPMRLLAALANAWPALVMIATVPPTTALVVKLTEAPPPPVVAAATETPTLTPTVTPTTPSPGTPMFTTTPTPSGTRGPLASPSSPQSSTPIPTPWTPVISPTPSTPMISPTVPTAPVQASVVIQPAENGRIDRIMLPIFKEAKGCRGVPQACTGGLDIDSTSASVLRALADVLVRCAQEGQTKITVDVRGFASSSEFRDFPDGNRQLADLRAKAVAKELNSLGNQERFKAYPISWDTLRQMQNARHYVDIDKPGNYWLARGVLNRRAEVIFPAQHLGACDVDDILTRVFPQWHTEP